MSDPISPSQELQLRISRPAPDVVVVHVAGEVDMLRAPALDAAITAELDLAPPSLLLDLTGVSFLASGGLAVLIRAKQTAASATRLVLVSDSRAVLRPLEVTKITELFTIHPSVDIALADRIPHAGGA